MVGVTMDDDEKTIQEIADYLTAKNVAQNCSVCGQSEDGWAIYAPYPYTPTLPYGNDKGTLVVGSEIIPTLTTKCKNCGFLRMFDLKMFEAWRDGR